MRLEIYQNKVYCPVVKFEIGDLNCEDAANVAEGFHPLRFTSEEFLKIPNWEKTCQNCKNNPYNKE